MFLPCFVISPESLVAASSELLYCVTHWSFCKIPSRSLQTPQSAADHSVYILGFFLKRNGSSAGSWQPPRLVALQ